VLQRLTPLQTNGKHHFMSYCSIINDNRGRIKHILMSKYVSATEVNSFTDKWDVFWLLHIYIYIYIILDMDPF
jgi:hypothetical protein